MKTVKLIKSDIDCNSNKYWTATLFDDGRIEAEYGRVGVTSQKTSYPSSRGGERFFNKKVKEKEKKGYVEAKVVGEAGQVKSVANSELLDIAKSQIQTSGDRLLDDLVSRLVKENIHAITSSTNITYNNDTGLFQTPLGIVTPEAINDARDCLASIAPLARKQDWENRAFKQKINEYLSLIPQNIGMGKFNPKSYFSDVDKTLRQQNDILDSLKASYEALKTQPKKDGKKDLEQVFELSMSLADSKEVERVRKFYNKTRKSMHACHKLDVKHVYLLDIPSMSDTFNPSKLDNVWELWHGTKSANLLSILKSGLCVSPPSTAAIAGKMFGNGIYFSDQSTKSLNYCVDPLTKILKDDLQWVTAAELQVGDGLIAFDENNLKIENGKGRSTTRRWRRALVTGAGRSSLPCYMIYFENGDKIKVSENHKFLYCRSGSKVEWIEAKNLKVGHRIPKYLETWSKDKSFEAGWLSGFFDGKGYCCGGESGGLGANQLPGKVYDYLVELVSKRDGENWTISDKPSGNSPTHYVYLKGSYAERMKFLGEINALRLTENYIKWLDGRIFQKNSLTKVSNVVYLGEAEVVTLGTSTKTFIADGYACHNSHGYWHGGARSNNCFMFLANVAMGNYYSPKRSYGERYPVKGYDSTFAEAGKAGVYNNEMIVYNDKQVNLIRLVEFEG